MDKIDAGCVEQVSRVAQLLQGKWTIHILCAIRDRPLRLSGLKRAIPSASKKALTASLRALETEGFVRRRDMSSTVLRVEYEVVEAFRGPLMELLDHLAEWTRLYGNAFASRGDD
jgi:DNA-binding HxlR family transcriptional regulator